MVAIRIARHQPDCFELLQFILDRAKRQISFGQDFANISGAPFTSKKQSEDFAPRFGKQDVQHILLRLHGL